MPLVSHPDSFGAHARTWIARRAWWLVPAVIALCIAVPKMWQGDWRVDMGLYAGVGYQSWTRVFAGDLSGLYALTEATDPTGKIAIPYFNKPPLPLLAHGLTLHVLGRSVWATRLPSVAVLVACVLLTVCIARQLMNRRTAMMAGIVAATTMPLVSEATMISLDLWQLLFILGCVALVVRDASWPVDAATGAPATTSACRVGWCTFTGGAVLGLGLLCKPLVALLAVPLLCAWLLVVGRGRLIGWLLGGTLAGLVLPLAWYLAAYGHWGRVFIDEHFGRQIIDRAEARLDNRRSGAESPFFYATHLLTMYWPWLITLTLSVRALASAGLNARARRAVWLAVIFGFGWFMACSLFADKRPRYILPAYPVWAVASAVWLCWCAPTWVGWLRRVLARSIAPVGVIVALAIAFAPFTVHAPPGASWVDAIGAVQGLGPSTDVYAAGLSKYDRCRFLMNLGRWPIPLAAIDREYTSPPDGAVVLYDTRARWRPGQSEVVIRSAGEYTLTRLRGPWQPVRRDDGQPAVGDDLR